LAAVLIRNDNLPDNEITYNKIKSLDLSTANDTELPLANLPSGVITDSGDGRIYVISDVTVHGTSTTIPHGLGKVPTYVWWKPKSAIAWSTYEVSAPDATNVYLMTTSNDATIDLYVR
jgi:hypothetical protein